MEWTVGCEAIGAEDTEEEFRNRIACFFLLVILCTSKCRSVSTISQCFCRTRISWLCRYANSFLIICSLSWIASSLTPSSNRRFRNFSVETVTLSIGDNSSVLDIRGNMPFTACNASSHCWRSSRVSALRCSLLVPVNIENLLSSDLLSRIDETWNAPKNQKIE